VSYGGWRIKGLGAQPPSNSWFSLGSRKPFSFRAMAEGIGMSQRSAQDCWQRRVSNPSESSVKSLKTDGKFEESAERSSASPRSRELTAGATPGSAVQVPTKGGDRRGSARGSARGFTAPNGGRSRRKSLAGAQDFRAEALGAIATTSASVSYALIAAQLAFVMLTVTSGALLAQLPVLWICSAALHTCFSVATATVARYASRLIIATRAFYAVREEKKKEDAEEERRAQLLKRIQNRPGSGPIPGPTPETSPHSVALTPISDGEARNVLRTGRASSGGAHHAEI